MCTWFRFAFVARSSAWAANRVIGTGVCVVACVSGYCDWLRTVMGRGVTSVSAAHGLAAVTGLMKYLPVSRISLLQWILHTHYYTLIRVL